MITDEHFYKVIINDDSVIVFSDLEDDKTRVRFADMIISEGMNRVHDKSDETKELNFRLHSGDKCFKYRIQLKELLKMDSLLRMGTLKSWTDQIIDRFESVIKYGLYDDRS